MKKIIVGLALLSSFGLMAKEANLENKLDDLRIPNDQVSSVISQDQLFAINMRYSSLVNRHELSVAGGNNFTPDSHLTTRQLSGSYRYHLNSTWSFGLRYQKIYNELSSAGEKLFDDKSIVPDSDYALSSLEGFANLHTFYGKMRINSSNVIYFDNYITLGVGQIELAESTERLFTADVGFAFWLGKHMSTRIGMRNELYSQNQITGRRNIHNAIGYVEVGFLFGEGN